MKLEHLAHCRRFLHRWFRTADLVLKQLLESKLAMLASKRLARYNLIEPTIPNDLEHVSCV